MGRPDDWFQLVLAWEYTAALITMVLMKWFFPRIDL